MFILIKPIQIFFVIGKYKIYVMHLLYAGLKFSDD